MKKGNKKVRRITTIRGKKAQNLIIENGGNVGNAMRAAGFSDAYAKNPQKFKLTGAGQELVKWIDQECTQIRKRMRYTRNQAEYKDLAATFVNFQKLRVSTMTGKNEDDKELTITIKHFKE